MKNLAVQVKMGMKEEMEHKDVTGGDKKLTRKIVNAHIEEKSDYYTRLKEAMKSWDKIEGMDLISKRVGQSLASVQQGARSMAEVGGGIRKIANTRVTPALSRNNSPEDFGTSLSVPSDPVSLQKEAILATTGMNVAGRAFGKMKVPWSRTATAGKKAAGTRSTWLRSSDAKQLPPTVPKGSGGTKPAIQNWTKTPSKKGAKGVDDHFLRVRRAERPNDVAEVQRTLASNKDLRSLVTSKKKAPYLGDNKGLVQSPPAPAGTARFRQTRVGMQRPLGVTRMTRPVPQAASIAPPTAGVAAAAAASAAFMGSAIGGSSSTTPKVNKIKAVRPEEKKSSSWVPETMKMPK